MLSEAKHLGLFGILTSIELSETFAFPLSIKGDLKFPVTEELSETAPYARISEGVNSVSCGGICHREWRQVEVHGDGVMEYASTIVYPKPVRDVKLYQLERIREKCGDKESHKCNFYRSVFDYGEVTDYQFPAISP